MELNLRDRELLAFEQQWWRVGDHKERAVREFLGMSIGRYQQLLNAVIDHPAALEFDAALVRRLRRQRALRLGSARLSAHCQPRLRPAPG